jgi:hypothetical protein
MYNHDFTNHTQDTRVASILTTKPRLLEDLNSHVFGQVTQQIKSCLRHHKKCTKKIGNFTPKRLIDVGNKAANETPRLYETKNNVLPYVSLSYCWGEKQEGVTTSKTYDSYLKELPIMSISKSIRDAIEVTRGLGFQYLWADALCIKQDDDDDKMSEINAMGQIYRNATVTIAAANSASANHGFLGDFPLYSPCKLPVLLPSGDIGTIFTEAVVKMESLTITDLTPLDSRGWALQEFLLSPRTLHFGLHDLTWHCQTKDLSNVFSTHTSFLPCSRDHHPRKNAVSIVPDFVARLPPSVFQGLQIAGEKENLELMKFWLAMVAHYSHRSFTYEKDRLPALAGLASEIQKAMGIEYLGGIWENDLISQLAWSGMPSATHFEPTQATVNTDRRPSWSWMSAQNGISFEELKTKAATSLSCNPVVLPLARQSSFTTSCGCRLLLLAKIIRASYIGRRYGFNFKMDYKGILDGKLDKDTHWMLLGYTPRGNSIGIVLQPTKSGEFVRIGLIKVPKRNRLWDHFRVELREVLLV